LVAMGKSEVTRIDCHQQGQQLRVLKGTLWVTGHLTGDILLQAGDTFRLQPSGPFIVEALAESEWTLQA
jgi:hypothetical protein